MRTPGGGRRVDGGGVVLVVDGGKHQRFSPGVHGLGHHAVLGLVILLGLGAGDVQLDVVFGRGRLRGPQTPKARIRCGWTWPQWPRGGAPGGGGGRRQPPSASASSAQARVLPGFVHMGGLLRYTGHADLDTGAHVGHAVDAQAVLFAEIDLERSSTFLMPMPVRSPGWRCQDGLHLFGGHAHRRCPARGTGCPRRPGRPAPRSCLRPPSGPGRG